MRRDEQGPGTTAWNADDLQRIMQLPAGPAGPGAIASWDYAQVESPRSQSTAAFPLSPPGGRLGWPAAAGSPFASNGPGDPARFPGGLRRGEPFRSCATLENERGARAYRHLQRLGSTTTNPKVDAAGWTPTPTCWVARAYGHGFKGRPNACMTCSSLSSSTNTTGGASTNPIRCPLPVTGNW